MTDYKNNPDLALATLKKLAEEIPSGVSQEDLGRILIDLHGNFEELIANLGNTMVSTLKDELETLWTKHNIKQKLENVNKLKKISGDTFNEELLLNQQKAHSLRKITESMKSETKKMQDRNSQLMENIRKYTPDTLTRPK